MAALLALVLPVLLIVYLVHRFETIYEVLKEIRDRLPASQTAAGPVKER